MANIKKPELMEVIGVRQQTIDVKSVSLRFLDAERAKTFSFNVGQFGIFSVFGYGESTFNICSSSNWKDRIEFCFRKVGRVTEAMWKVEVGDVIGFRGPYGNGYPMDVWKGHDLIFLGGGIAMPPIRCAIWYALENRKDYGDISIVYGARTVGDLVFTDELDEWSKRERTRVIQCVDPGGETPGWQGEVGFVPSVFERSKIAADANSIVLMIGPPIMIKVTMKLLTSMGVPPENVYTSLENRMKCGVGKCGRCNAGPVYVCKEGPVFSIKQLNSIPMDY
jgi:NAD(P)H-flavin reductase